MSRLSIASLNLTQNRTDSQREKREREREKEREFVSAQIVYGPNNVPRNLMDVL